MKLLSLLLAATAALAAPLEKRAVTDVDILQYALTLEHLENVFYKQALSNYPRQQFLDAGFSSDFYNNLLYIVHDEENHVQQLTAALTKAGASPVAACTYKFPYTDPKSFVTLSSVLEGVGTSAYLGGAGLITDKTYLGVAGSILVTEALHTSIQRFAIKEVGPASPYGTPLGINEVYTLAAAFITGCPGSNLPLPVKAFPALTAVQGTPASPGMPFTFSTTATLPSGQVFVTFVSGLTTTSVPATQQGGNLVATVPATAMGQTYAVLTSANVTAALTDDLVLAGPAVVEVTPPSPTYDTNVL